ncbi:hypothetical protein OFN31_29240, partial [Escherichia coli]|nr:hypothetical protein [Escherichia coli]
IDFVSNTKYFYIPNTRPNREVSLSLFLTGILVPVLVNPFPKRNILKPNIPIALLPYEQYFFHILYIYEWN